MLVRRSTCVAFQCSLALLCSGTLLYSWAVVRLKEVSLDIAANALERCANVAGAMLELLRMPGRVPADQ